MYVLVNFEQGRCMNRWYVVEATVTRSYVVEVEDDKDPDDFFADECGYQYEEWHSTEITDPIDLEREKRYAHKVYSL
jgi:hypothetical protein